MTEEKLETFIHYYANDVTIDTEFTEGTVLTLTNENGRLEIFKEDDCIEFVVDGDVLFRWPNNNSSKLDEILEHLKRIEGRLCHNSKMINAL